MTQNLAHPVAIFIRGLPGSGKSFIAAELARQLGTQTAVLLDPDATDYESDTYKHHVKTMEAEGVEQKLHAYRFLRGQAYKAIENGKIIIWDQPFRNLEIFHKMIGRMHEHAEAVGTTVKVLVVELEIDLDTAKARVEKRKAHGGHGPSDTTFENFSAEHKSFDDQDFNIVKVKGKDDVGKSVEKIMKALLPLTV